MKCDFSKEQLENNFQIIFNLEYLGIRIEDVKEENSSFGLIPKTVYYYSVPESSTIEVDNTVKTSDDLKIFAKKLLIDMIIDSCKDAYPDDEEFIKDVENNTSDYFKFYAKVRKGEVWNKEMGDNRIKELGEEIENAIQYKEV